jgi:hypothetical protein
MRRSTRIPILSTMLCVMLGLLVAADDPAGKPKPPPVVTVTRADGPAIRGQIISADPDQVVIQPARKAGEKADPEKITLSTGLTYQKALDAWKLEHHDQLCPVCHGNRVTLCSTCKGTAHDPASAADCKTCRGELLVDCKQPKCDKGKIPCPNTCLKRYEGSWVPHDGKIVRYYNSPRGGRGWFSEAHVGDLLVMDKASGVMQDMGKCPTCGGTTYVECPTCHGDAKVPCPTCVARKDAPLCPAHCEEGRTACTACNGTGLKGAQAPTTQTQ